MYTAASAPNFVVRRILRYTGPTTHRIGPQRIAIFTYNHDDIQYDTIEDFNMDQKVECDQLNLAHETTKSQYQLSSTYSVK